MKRKEHPFKETHVRSITKALSWRLIATITTFCIAYFVFLLREKAEVPEDLVGQAARQYARQAAKIAAKDAIYLAGTIALLELLLKLFLYYAHERLWQSIRFGWISRYNRSRRLAKIRKRRLRRNRNNEANT